MGTNNIYITKTQLPDPDIYNKYLKIIWKNNWITNHGPLAVKLEKKLKNFLKVPNLFFVSNGTVALEIAIKAMDLKDEIITTPFSYVATTSSIVWTNCKPVFVDIDRNSLNIDCSLIERAITSKTSAILATHVYGNPCNVERIRSIARRNGLKVIYDSAHCFDVKYKGKNLLNYGDISTLSFHATKIFHTAEGGAVITNSKKLADKIAYTRNFGHKGEEAFQGLGINGKNSELHAAMGLSLFRSIKSNFKKRKAISLLYKNYFKNTSLILQLINNDTSYNYSYFPVIFENEKQLLRIRKVLNLKGIYPRRYFYPALNKLNYVHYSLCRVTDSISKKVLCLPLYPDLKIQDVNKICKLIIQNI